MVATGSGMVVAWDDLFGADSSRPVLPSSNYARARITGAACTCLTRDGRAPRGVRTTSTASSTSAPPASWAGPSDSPNTAHASATATTGSSVERIDAAAGPTRRSPAKNRQIPATVETRARPPSDARPAGLTAPGGPAPGGGAAGGGV